MLAVGGLSVTISIVLLDYLTIMFIRQSLKVARSCARVNCKALVTVSCASGLTPRVNFVNQTLPRHFCAVKDSDKINKDFFHVCGKGDIEYADILLVAGWDVNARDKAGATALMWAAAEGHLSMVKFLIKKGADLNAKNVNGSTALWHAIWKDRKEVAMHLKEVGADINAQDVDGNSLLHLVAEEGKMEYVKLLLEWGVNVYLMNEDGVQAKDLAQDEAVRKLLNKDIDFTYY